jgi:hypothetical protein
MTDPSPPTNGNGARKSAGPQNENNDTGRISEEPSVCNRKLIRSERGFKVYEVMERRRRFHYEIVNGTQRWSFPLLYSAYLKLDRLIAKAGGAQRP